MSLTTTSKRVLSTGLILLSCLAISQPAQAFADDDARKAIVELRQQIRTLTEANQRARVQLADQIEALEQEVTRLRGDMEQLGRPSSGLGSPGGTSGARAPDARSSDPREQSAFDQSIESFRKGQYKEATENLTAFLTLYPDSKLTPTAQFYLGSSRYASKDFKGAIATLDAMVKRYPREARAPDALLMIAGSQFELNNRAASKATLQRIVQEYKGTPAAETAAKRIPLL
jgi:tol-pal system protein YbgF